MKKVLIFTVTAGNGHNSIANAVREECENRGVEARVVDLLHEFCDSKLYRWINEKGYGMACQYACKIYNWFFRHYQRVNPKKYYKSPVQKPLLKMYGKLLKYINEYKPDAIFCSHFYPCIMLSNLRQEFELPAKIYSVITDYVVCPYWECAAGIDKVMIPDESYVDYMLSKGFKNEQLVPYGLTVSPKFSKEISKQDARKTLGLEDKFTAFVMYGGGFWAGNYKIVKNLIKNIKEPLQIVVANGRDEKGKKKIDKLKVPENIILHNYGFCKNVDVIMSASDILIGKAGGVSVTEALNKRLPLLAGSNLPQQEECNVEMLLKHKAGRRYKSKRQMAKTLNELMKSPKELDALKANVEKIRKPDATKIMVDMILSSEVNYKKQDINYSKVNKKIKDNLKNKGKKK